MNTIITEKEAIRFAVNYAGIENDSPRCIENMYEDGLYMLIIRTMFQRYEFYVDAANRDIVGINSEPLTDLEQLYDDDLSENSVFAA